MNQINFISINKSPCVSLCTCEYENPYDMGINTSEDYEESKTQQWFKNGSKISDPNQILKIS